MVRIRSCVAVSAAAASKAARATVYAASRPRSSCWSPSSRSTRYLLRGQRLGRPGPDRKPEELAGEPFRGSCRAGGFGFGHGGEKRESIFSYFPATCQISAGNRPAGAAGHNLVGWTPGGYRLPANRPEEVKKSPLKRGGPRPHPGGHPGGLIPGVRMRSVAFRTATPPAVANGLQPVALPPAGRGAPSAGRLPGRRARSAGSARRRSGNEEVKR